MQPFPFQDWLVFNVGQQAAQVWWIGPLLVVFCWLVVPIQRARIDVLNGGDGPTSGFWWAPGWGFLGIVGVGAALVASPVLDPGLARAWGPFLWPGFTAEIPGAVYSLLIVLGLIFIGKGLLLYAHAWAMDRSDRYRAWRWHHVFRGPRN